MNGRCQNGGCQRLATIVVKIPFLGERDLCYGCWQALQGIRLGDKVRELRPTTGAAA